MMMDLGSARVTAVVSTLSLLASGVGLVAKEVLDEGAISIGFTISLITTVVTVLIVIFKDRMQVEKRLDAADMQNREIWKEIRLLAHKPADESIAEAVLGEPPKHGKK